jgi:hypothetical protein
MEANQNSTGHQAWKRTRRLIRRSFRIANTSANRFAEWTSGTAFPWCRDHLLSLAVLMAFPLGIAVYQWASTNSKKSVKSSDFADHDERSNSARNTRESVRQTAEIEQADVSDVHMAFQAPELLAVPDDAGGPEFAPLPLPISIDDPDPPKWNAPVPAEYETSAGSTGGVWLTGTIEEVSGSRNVIQNASRVHELTSPDRH